MQVRYQHCRETKNNKKTKIIQQGWHFTISRADKPMGPWVSQQTRVEIFREKYRSYGIINVSFFTIQTLSACEYAAFHFLPTCSTHFRHTTAIPATRGGNGRLFEARRLFSIFAFRMGAYSRWARSRGWALIRINTVWWEYGVNLWNYGIFQDILKRPTSKRPTCQKLAFRGKVSPRY